MLRRGIGLLLAVAWCGFFAATGAMAVDAPVAASGPEARPAAAKPGSSGGPVPAAPAAGAGPQTTVPSPSPFAPGPPAADTAAPAVDPTGALAGAPGPALPQPPAGGQTLEKRLLSISLTGARALLYLLLVLSVVCVAVALERVVLYRRENPLGPGFRARLAELLEKDDLPSALHAVENVRGVNAALVREGLLNFAEGAAVIEEVLASRLILERARLERRLLILGTIGNNAPFIGLLGTVMGIIKAFHDLSTVATQGPQAVMAGISEALIATAVGLFVAIPAVVLFNWLKSRAKGLQDEAEANAKIVLAYARRADEGRRGGH